MPTPNRTTYPGATSTIWARANKLTDFKPIEPPFERFLTGGHRNSLGRTVEIVEAIEGASVSLQAQWIEALFACYHSSDELVRLRTSNAMKRLIRAQPTRFDGFAERYLDFVAHIDQDSCRWTTAQLFGEQLARCDEGQIARASEHFFTYLGTNDDWIVVNACIKTLSNMALGRIHIEARLRPMLENYTSDRRKSVANAARKGLIALDSGKPFK